MLPLFSLHNNYICLSFGEQNTQYDNSQLFYTHLIFAFYVKSSVKHKKSSIIDIPVRFLAILSINA